MFFWEGRAQGPFPWCESLQEQSEAEEPGKAENLWMLAITSPSQQPADLIIQLILI